MRRPRPALPCRNCLAGRAMTGAHPLRGLTCAVIGGGGFLGANLCPKLLALGAIVRVYGRTRYYDAPFQGVTWLAGALSDTDKLASELEGADVEIGRAHVGHPVPNAQLVC